MKLGKFIIYEHPPCWKPFPEFYKFPPFVPRPDRRFHRSTTGTPASDTSRPASGEGGWRHPGYPLPPKRSSSLRWLLWIRGFVRSCALNWRIIKGVIGELGSVILGNFGVWKIWQWRLGSWRSLWKQVLLEVGSHFHHGLMTPLRQWAVSGSESNMSTKLAYTLGWSLIPVAGPPGGLDF